MPKYLYRSSSNCQGLMGMANREISQSYQITSGSNGHCEYKQVSIDALGLDDLDEFMAKWCYERFGEITGNDVKPVGTKAEIPVASEVPDGFKYCATDENRVYYSIGDAWYYEDLTLDA